MQASRPWWLPLALAAALSAGACLCAPALAQADELADVRAQLQAKLDEAKNTAHDITASQAKAMTIQAKISAQLIQIEAWQAEHAEFEQTAADQACALYKNADELNPFIILGDSDSLAEAMQRLDARERVLHEYDETLAQVDARQAELEAAYAQTSADKDEQDALLDELREKQATLKTTIAELRERESELDAEQLAELAQAAAAAGEVAKTFETGTVAADQGGWTTGLASAYGGTTDPGTPIDQPTATGTMCDDWSVGVAVPLAWGPSAYYGRRVEISYEGRSIIAPVVDCGGMNGGERALDLQPGVFKAFGCTSCDDWGVREVRYRFLT